MSGGAGGWGEHLRLQAGGAVSLRNVMCRSGVGWGIVLNVGVLIVCVGVGVCGLCFITTVLSSGTTVHRKLCLGTSECYCVLVL